MVDFKDNEKSQDNESQKKIKTLLKTLFYTRLLNLTSFNCP